MNKNTPSQRNQWAQHIDVNNIVCFTISADKAISTISNQIFYTNIGNESVPKIIINDTVIFWLNCNQHLFHKIASVYFV